MKSWCKEGEAPCVYHKQHPSVRPGKGEKGRADRGSIYPDALCSKLVYSGAALFGKVRELPLDPANTADCHEDCCTFCGNITVGKHTLWICSQCTGAYHLKCVSDAGKRRGMKFEYPKKCKECQDRGCRECPVWLCPMCQATAVGRNGAL